MRILVTVKYTPDLQSTRSFSDGMVTRNADDGTMNELDEHAVEAALQVVERHGGEVYALTMGNDDAVMALRKALQLGVQHAVHVNDPAAAGSDVFATARVLAAAIKKIHVEEPLDLVITGMAALDGLTSMLPTALAAELDFAQLTLASSLEVDVEARRATVSRHLPDARETVSAPLPAVVSVTDEANKPRYPNFKLIMAARSAPITTWALADVGIDPATVGTGAARTTVVEAVPRPPKEGRIVVTDTGEGGNQLADFLIERGLV